MSAKTPLSKIAAAVRAATKQRLAKRGLPPEQIKSAAAAAAASAVAARERKRERDREYRRGVREALKQGAPAEVALESGRIRRARVVAAAKESSARPQSGTPCEFYRLTRNAGDANWMREKVENPPRAVYARAPLYNQPYWGKYTVCSPDAAQHWASLIVGPRGAVKDSTIRLDSAGDALRNAHERVQMPTNSTRKRMRGGEIQTVYLILIPLRYV